MRAHGQSDTTNGCSLDDSPSGLVVELAGVAALALALLEGEAHAHLHARLLGLRALARLVALTSAVIAAHRLLRLRALARLVALLAAVIALHRAPAVVGAP
eukprot:scaffold40506_cov69-Phaeocystis_antarctica.AAC.2